MHLHETSSEHKFRRVLIVFLRDDCHDESCFLNWKSPHINFCQNCTEMLNCQLGVFISEKQFLSIFDLKNKLFEAKEFCERQRYP